ncbi:hypothetical protein [Phocicoccus pinnipedialis]|uniref:Uncharacterized protein n=1 Tax=Phocicoccus pinnipedialis TaxID=110845 RepID=A0A6V7R0E3_9BACL|nr:hypothetical protein [Jeotgalicoccus pinnipedialis]MBP1938709.1 hypothetical protein [Jeotgalicoccus pinnipedialis]CAD2070493.1 hypothetical protein JEOPIN946_00019 [Jeotgalicoccus pinnipedialis]
MKFESLLNIQFPIIQAGMANVSGDARELIQPGLDSGSSLKVVNSLINLVH